MEENMAKCKDPTEKAIQINTFLYECAAKIDPKKITLELCKNTFEGADVNYGCMMIGGATMLMIASQYGKEDIVKWLLEEKNADVNMTNNEGHTALDCALSRDGNDAVTMLLLQNGAEGKTFHEKNNSNDCAKSSESDQKKGLISNFADTFYEAEDELEDLVGRFTGHLLEHYSDPQEEN